MRISLPPARVLGKCLALPLLAFLLSPPTARTQSVYSWNATSSANWNTAADWSLVSGSGTYPGAGDTANFSGSSSTYAVTYDAAESGLLGALNMVGTSGAGNVNVYLARSLTLSGGGSLYDTTSTGYENLVFAANNVTLTIGNGTDAATFTYGNAGVTKGSAMQILTGSTTGSLIAVANQSTFNWVMNSLGSSVGAPIEVQNGGILNLDSEAAGQKYVMTSLTVDTGGKVTSSSSNGNAGSGALYVSGNAVFNGQMTAFTTSGNNPNGLVFSNVAAAGGSNTQLLTFGSGATALDATLRPSSVGAGTVSTVKVTSAATGSVGYAMTGTNIVDALNFYGSGMNGNTLVFQLGGNLIYGGTAGAFSYGSTSVATSTVTETVDLNGFTYDMATAGKSFTVAWAGSTNSAGSLINFVNSAGSASPSTLKASYFNLNAGTNAANTAVGAYVTLQATGTGALDDLGNSVGTGTIDATSVFSATGAGVSTLASNRSIGGIAVGTGSSATTLSLGSAVTAAGIATVNAGAVLDLYNGTGTGSSGKGTEGSYALTAAGLSGSGTIENVKVGTGTAIAATTLTVNNTGTSGIPTTNTFSGTITDTAAAPLSVTLTSTNTGTQVLSGANTYHGATTINGGTFLANNTTGSATGSGSISVAHGATFGGSGSVNPTGTGTMTVGGTLAAGTAGSSATSLTVNASGNTLGSGNALLSFSGATLAFNLGAGNASSELKLTGSYAGEVAGLSGLTFAFSDLTAGSLLAGKYTLIQSDSASANPFQGLSLGVLSGFTLSGLSAYTAAGDTVQLELNQLAGTNDYAIQLAIAAVPEPSAWALALAALPCLALLRSRRFRAV